MRLSEWAPLAPNGDAFGPKVMAVLRPVIVALGAGGDPTCWITWGEDAADRYQLMAPTQPGLVVCHVRVNVPQEGPRVSAKLVRWGRVQLGELALETQQGHRLVSFQVEQQVLKGVDRDGDRVAAFARILFRGVDGRPLLLDDVDADVLPASG